jgi:hypothetical protein
MYKSEFPEISPLIFNPDEIVVMPFAAAFGAVLAAGGTATGTLTD